MFMFSQLYKLYASYYSCAYAGYLVYDKDVVGGKGVLNIQNKETVR